MFRSLSVLSAGVVAFAMAGAALADNDLVRLDGKGDAELMETRGGGGHGGGGFHGGGGGFHGGGYRGGFGGYGGYRGGFGYGGYRGVGYGGYRGYGYGGYRGYGYGGYYRPYYGFGYGLGLGLGLGYGGYYGGYGGGYYGVGYGGYGGGYGGYYGSQYNSAIGPCTCTTAVAPATTLSLYTPIMQGPNDGTFPYDGGPRDGAFGPLSSPTGIPNRTALPADGRLVSVPAASSGYHFVAFGEPSMQPTQHPMNSGGSDTLRVSYPAFGEPMPSFSGGTTVYTTVLH